MSLLLSPGSSSEVVGEDAKVSSSHRLGKDGQVEGVMTSVRMVDICLSVRCCVPVVTYVRQLQGIWNM